MATESHPLAIGQVWSDNDPRKKGETVVVIDLDETHATIRRDVTGRTSRVKRERFRPIATGYIFGRETPGPDNYVPEGYPAATNGAIEDVWEDDGIDIPTINDGDEFVQGNTGNFTTKHGGEIVAVEAMPNREDSRELAIDAIEEALEAQEVAQTVAVSIKESHEDEDGVTVITKAELVDVAPDQQVMSKLAATRTALQKADDERKDALAKGHKDLGPFPLDTVSSKSHMWFGGRFYRWIKSKKGKKEAVRETDTKTLRKLHGGDL